MMEGRPVPPLPPGVEHDLGWVYPPNAIPYRVSVRRTGEGFFEVISACPGRTPQVIRGPFDTLAEAVAAGEHFVQLRTAGAGVPPFAGGVRGV